MKHNDSHLKRMQRSLSGLRVWLWQSDTAENGLPAYYMEAKRHPFAPYHACSEQLARSVVHYPFNWKICARVLCSNGSDSWLETVDTVAHQRPINAIAELYAAMEREAVNAVQSRQIVDVGWIAQTFWKDPKIDSGWEHAHIGVASEERKWLYRIGKAEYERSKVA